jgi:hypothetical protein
MGLSAKQTNALRRGPDHRYVRTRESHGRELTYLEGWYVISQANRIFGFDGWSRETVESRCVMARDNKGSFSALYIAKVRVTVHAGEITLIREGHGTGESHSGTPGEVHDIALKAAETDGTKRALATFGRPFGLELYRGGKPVTAEKQSPSVGAQLERPDRHGFHPDDTTPIPRPSRFYGRKQDVIADTLRKERREAEKSLAKTPQAQTVDNALVLSARAPALIPDQPQKIDKSQLPLGEPKRLRDRAHLTLVASRPCLICGRQPSDPHHVRFAQPRAIGMKVSDEFVVPLCRGHHRQLHQVGNEQAWWSERKLEPLKAARALWEETHPKVATEQPVEQARKEATQHDR